MSKTALITGASSGIGKALAYLFAKDKIDVVLIARSKEKLEQIAEDIRKLHATKVYTYVTDLSHPDAPGAIYNWCKKENISVHYLINNAGFGDFGRFVESNWQKQKQMINLNILSLTHLTHLLLPSMIENKNGKVLNVASTASFQPGPLMSVYFATKAFVLYFSEAIANELSGTGVTVTALCPGATESNFQKQADMENSRLVKDKKLPSAQQVAKYGYKAMKKGKKVAIHGIMNRLLVFSVRFTPRSWVVKLVRIIQS